ncbi:hypothetical protein ACFQH1_02150 [Lactiplantibacillus daoliensis]|uniref:Uncharacterized protein n=1 Tax=Lactiplantibacillus daoliensis TaxID=2559916 RepID=A0ABW1UFW3_9LACO|nr:hypothetical protein [Lactiplantibacillus daoliensis]
MKSHQQVLVWLTGLRANGRKWRWLIVLTMSVLFSFGQFGWQVQASTTPVMTQPHSVKAELFDSRTGAMLSLATTHDGHANQINQLSLVLLVSSGVIGSYCWYRAKHLQK